jgi:HAD superfamily phosphoserine phosphatase-like hydrolase
MKRVAVFDIDGTLFRSSLLIELVEQLVRTGVFPISAKSIYEEAHQRWIDREGTYEEYVQRMIDAFREHIQGVEYSVFSDVSKIVALAQRKRVYKYTRDLIKKMRADDFYILAISHSPKTILDFFAPYFGFDKVYGIMYELGPTDCFTGTLVDEHVILNKANVLKRAVEKAGLSLEGSIGVGDTETDVSFLELVEEPICFNPNAKLYKYAQRMGWKVVVERKDVIYDIPESRR